MRKRLNVNAERENSRPARGGQARRPAFGRPQSSLPWRLCSCSPAAAPAERLSCRSAARSPTAAARGPARECSSLSAQSADAVTVRPGWACFAVDGTFHATSFNEGDGLFPGRYRVAVRCWPPSAASGEAPAQAVSPVDAKYGSPETSGLEVEIKPGERSVSVELNVPKPAG